MNIEYRIIEVNSSDYNKELELRDQVLRKPIGRSIKEDPIHLEVKDCHIGAFLGDRIVATLMLVKISETETKMRQVAVDREYQGLGIGAMMVKFAEEKALNLGYKKISLHGRKHVELFYTKLGYTTVGDEFIEVGMPHVAMFKDLVTS